MTLTEARSILDDVRAGAAQWRSEAEITAALRETGDLSSLASNTPVDNSENREIVGEHLNWLFPTAAPARTPHDALNPAGVPPLPRNPGESRESRMLLPSQFLPANPLGGLAALPRTLARSAREAA
jgi:hypothetical protein